MESEIEKLTTAIWGDEQCENREWYELGYKAAQSKPADEDSEAIWTKALNDAYDVWELNKRETPFPLIAMNHIRSNYDLKAKNIQ